MESRVAEDLISLIGDFLECAVHCTLYARKVYPSHLFEQRRFLGITVWQSRHPDINKYIQRVLDNVQPLLQQNVMDRLVVIINDSSGQPQDHLSFKCSINTAEAISTEKELSGGAIGLVEEELRATILRMTLLDAQLPVVREDCTWTLMAVTRPSSACPSPDAAEELLQSTLRNGEWYMDNNQLSEQVSAARRVVSANSDPSPSPKLLSVKSFRNALVNVAVYAHVFCA